MSLRAVLVELKSEVVCRFLRRRFAADLVDDRAILRAVGRGIPMEAVYQKHQRRLRRGRAYVLAHRFGSGIVDRCLRSLDSVPGWKRLFSLRKWR